MASINDDDPKWYLCCNKCHIMRLSRLLSMYMMKSSIISLAVFAIQCSTTSFAFNAIHHMVFFLLIFPSALQFLLTVPGKWRIDPSFSPKLGRMLFYIFCHPLGIAALLAGVAVNSIQLANSGNVNMLSMASIGMAVQNALVTLMSMIVMCKAYSYAKLRVNSKVGVVEVVSLT